MSDRLEDIIAFRKKKLEQIKAAGVDPYPSVTERTHTNKEALDNFELLAGKTVVLVGRIRSLRVMGKLIFAHIEDGSARIQLLFKADEIGEEVFKFLSDNFDIGDFIQATGQLFVTKTGEKTLQAASYKLLAKSLLPLPSEHYGLEDIEIRLRQRYLDILLNPSVKELFVKKNKFWAAMRSFLVERNFMEVEMPVLEKTPGGAEAEPFITHYNALDTDFYLRISLELPLKKMLVAGYEKVFEIGRIFRNEGVSTEHLQDYMQMEFYWAYGDFEKMMQLCQEMYQYIIQASFGTLKITSGGVTCDWSGNWEKVSYVNLFKEHTGLDIHSASDEDFRKYLDEKKVKYDPASQRGRLMDIIFKQVRVNIPQDKPVFLVDQPVELEPLAKRDPKDPRLVQRMQIIAYGTELGKGFGELNDPLDQRARFEEQMKLREAGDTEAQMLDEDYLDAMEHGMPPAAGFGVSERLFAVLADKSIREVVVFPPMKDAGSDKHGKAKETQVAMAILNKGANLAKWQELNSVAHLTAAFGARSGKKLLLQDEIHTEDKEKIKLNIQHAIMIKTAASSKDLIELQGLAKKAGLEVSEFTREMLETTNDKKVIEATSKKKLNEVEYLGVLIFGRKSDVENLTERFPLYE